MSEDAESRRKFVRRLVILGSVAGVAIAGGGLLGLSLLRNKGQNNSTTTESSSSLGTTSATQRTTATSTPTTSAQTGSTQQSSTTSGNSTSIPIAPFSQTFESWSKLRGVCWRWESLSLHPDQPNGPDPTVAFPFMRSMDMNFVRVDNVNMDSMINDPSYASKLKQVADYADANGVYCDYFSGMGVLQGQFPQDFYWPYANGQRSGYTAFMTDLANNYMTLSNPPNLVNGMYRGYLPLEAVYQLYLKPILQIVDSHVSTVAYGFLNEPNGITGDQVHTMLEYWAGRIRSDFGSNKAIIFQTAAGGVDATRAATAAPTKDLAPFVYEYHDYSQRNLESAAVQAAQSVGGVTAYLGEWGGPAFGSTGYESGFDTAINQIKNGSIPSTYYSLLYDSGSGVELMNTNGNPTAKGQYLSQDYKTILGVV